MTAATTPAPERAKRLPWSQRYMRRLSLYHPLVWRARLDLAALFILIMLGVAIVLPSPVAYIAVNSRSGNTTGALMTFTFIYGLIALFLSCFWAYAVCKSIRLRDVARYSGQPQTWILFGVLFSITVLACYATHASFYRAGQRSDSNSGCATDSFGYGVSELTRFQQQTSLVTNADEKSYYEQMQADEERYLKSRLINCYGMDDAKAASIVQQWVKLRYPDQSLLPLSQSDVQSELGDFLTLKYHYNVSAALMIAVVLMMGVGVLVRLVCLSNMSAAIAATTWFVVYCVVFGMALLITGTLLADFLGGTFSDFTPFNIFSSVVLGIFVLVAIRTALVKFIRRGTLRTLLVTFYAIPALIIVLSGTFLYYAMGTSSGSSGSLLPFLMSIPVSIAAISILSTIYLSAAQRPEA